MMSEKIVCDLLRPRVCAASAWHLRYVASAVECLCASDLIARLRVTSSRIIETKNRDDQSICSSKRVCCTYFLQ